MKRLLSICIFTLFTTLLTAQVTKTVNVTTAGTLTTLLTATEKSTVTNLTITGNVDARDIYCMSFEMASLSVIDISSVNIKSFSGSGGTSITSSTYPANEMPAYSFSLRQGSGDTNHDGKPITSIKLPSTLTSIGESSFVNCKALIEVIIPNSVRTIGDNAFASSGLNRVTIGSSVTSIGSNVFGYANRIIFNCLCSTPPSAEFSFNYVLPFVVYVPTNSVNAYSNTLGWSDHLIYPIGTNPIYFIQIQIGSNGNLKENNNILSSGFMSVIGGNAKTFTILPNTGYEISSLTYGGVDVKSQVSNNQFTTPIINADVTLNVTFKKITCRLSLQDASNGTINLLCDYGASPAFDFTPVTGWKVNTILYNATDVTSSLINGVYTVPTITANALLNVSFVSIATGAPELINNRIKVYSTNSEIIIEGTSEGETVTLYTVNGKQIQTVISKGERLSLPVDRDVIYLVKTVEKVFKVIL